MTISTLIAFMLALALLLCALLLKIARQIKAKGGNFKPKQIESRLAGQDKPGPAADNVVEEDRATRLPRAVGRLRQIKAVSEGGGDPSAAQELMDSGAYASCERRLEQAFQIYSSGRVSLETYETMVLAEAERAKRLRAEFRAMELAGTTSHEALANFREEIETIEIAVQWCLDWAEDLRSGTESGTIQIAKSEN